MFPPTRRSRRHRNPHTQDSEPKQPFFNRPVVQAKEEQTFFQPKLAIGQPGDQYEREADAVAEKVTGGQSQAPAVQEKPISDIQRESADSQMEKDRLVQEKPDIQREATPEEEEPVQMQPEEEEPVQMQTEEEEPVQMQTEEEEPVQMQTEEEEPVQMKPEGDGASASPQLSNRIRDKAGKGKPLPDKVRAEMEKAFGVGFDGVNIHTDSEAEQMNKELGAQAFTHGKDVYFNAGKYRPETAEGKRLLAHELTHIVQQGGGDAGKV
jgi:hypothetical protein